MRFNIELPKKINKINYFERKDEGCTLVSHNGANSDIYIIVDYGLDIDRSFAITDSTLQAIVKLQPDVEVKLNEKNIVATSKKGRYTGKYVDMNFAMPNTLYPNSCNVDLDILSKASNFTATTEKKPILMGVNVDANSNMVATDGFKIYEYRSNASNNLEGSITIDANLIKIASGIFSNKNIELQYNKNTVAFVDGNVMVVGRLLEGSFPSLANIFKIIESEAKYPLNKSEILECLNFTKMAGANLKVKDLGIYAILQENKFIGKSDEYFEKEIVYNGEEIIFDANYLELVLKTFKTDNINIATKNNGKGTLACFSEEGNESERIILLGVAKEIN